MKISEKLLNDLSLLEKDDKEICGFIVGRRGLYSKFIEVENISKRCDEYYMGFFSKLLAFFKILIGFYTMISVFHTHKVSLYPSLGDIKNFIIGFDYFIFSFSFRKLMMYNVFKKNGKMLFKILKYEVIK